MHSKRHINIKIFEGIRQKRLRSGVTARNTSEKANNYANLSAYPLSAFPARCRPRRQGCRAMIKSLQPCPKRYLLMQLARVAPRRAVQSESMVFLYNISAHANSYSERRGQFLRMRIRIRAQHCGMRQGFAL